MKLPVRFSYSFTESIKRHKSFVSLVVMIVGVCIFCAVLAGIKFNNSSMLISFSNVVVVKFLRDSIGFAGMLFTNIFVIAVFSTIIILSGIKKYSITIGLFFYGYYVYAQTLTLIAFVLEYGIINTLVIAVCMLIGMVVTLFLLLHLFLICIDCQNETMYIKRVISISIPIFIFIGIALLAQNIVFLVLRNFIIVLVY